MRTPGSVVELHLKIQAELGGAVFRGVQQATPGHEALVLFDDTSATPEQRSTMALKMSEFSADRVRSAIKHKRAEYERFEQFAEKAAVRVFSQFSKGVQPPCGWHPALVFFTLKQLSEKSRDEVVGGKQ
jgi:hypothetical protein